MFSASQLAALYILVTLGADSTAMVEMSASPLRIFTAIWPVMVPSS